MRFLGNRSSGRMGIEIAREAARRGHPTTLLLGPVGDAAGLDAFGVTVHRFETAESLRQLLDSLSPYADLVVMAAAVADYRPVTRHAGKLRREGKPITLDLEPVPDLLAEVASRRPTGQRIVGFALEPAERLDESARAKLVRKGIDAIVANPLETLDAAGIRGRLIHADGRVEMPSDDSEVVDKSRFAGWLLDRLEVLPSRER